MPLVQRFGWLTDHAGADIPAPERQNLIRLAAKGRKAFLGPRDRVEGAIGYDETWRLFINVTREDLHGSAGLGQRRSARKEQ
jgi:predicted transcriptional regulator of viral defense system